MSAPDFDEFAALWKQEPTAEEEQVFQSLARTVSRRARLIYRIELGLAVFLAIGLLAALFLKQAPGTWVVGTLVLAALGWSSWKRYELQRVATIVDCSDRQSLLAGAVTTARGRLRQSTWSLILVPPVFLALALKGMPRSAEALTAILARPTMLVGTAVVCLLMVYVAQQNVRLRRELRRLEILQAQYEAEADLDAGLQAGGSKP